DCRARRARVRARSIPPPSSQEPPSSEPPSSEPPSLEPPSLQPPSLGPPSLEPPSSQEPPSSRSRIPQQYTPRKRIKYSHAIDSGVSWGQENLADARPQIHIFPISSVTSISAQNTAYN